MGKKMAGSNSNGPTKAGKKHSFKEPAKPDYDKRDARLAGEQQFVRDSNARLTQIPDAGDAFQNLAKAFGVRTKPGRSWDTGLRQDDSRKRVVVPFGQLTNGY